ncbi:plectin isoform X34 [Papio anubis]|uniref:plectin isoform X34 n=1 Tax=Papio anubis TaxID=9555 RepID=UPI0012ADF0DB|nr:plectin isoform X34 [Papio anubis]
MAEAEAGVAVEVRGLPPAVPDELLTLYFENRRRSGGGPVLSWQRLGCGGILTFREPADAERVLAQADHELHGAQLSLRPAPPRAPARLLLQGLPPGTAPQRLEQHVQALLRASGLPVQPCYALASPRPDRALVQLPKPLSEADVRVLEEQAQNLGLEGSSVSLARVPQARAVRVVGDSASVDLLLLELYLENERRSGGGPLEDLRCLPGPLGTVASFQQWQVAERVLQQEHQLQGSELSLVPHYDVLEPEELAENTSGGDHPSTLGPRATKHAILRTGGLVTALQGAGTVTMGSDEEPGQLGSSLRTGPMVQGTGTMTTGSGEESGQSEASLRTGPMGSLGQAKPVGSMPMGSLEHEGLVSLRPVGLQEQEGPMSVGPVGSTGPVEISKGLLGQEGLVEIAMDSPGQEGLVGPMEIAMGCLEKAGPVSPGHVKLAGQEGLAEMVLLMEPGAMRFLQIYHEDLLAGLGDVALFPLEGPDVTGFRLCGGQTSCQAAEEFLRSLLGSISCHVLRLEHPGSARFLLGPEGQRLLQGLEAQFQCVFGTERLATATLDTGLEEVDPTEALPVLPGDAHTLWPPDSTSSDQEDVSLEEVRELLATLEGLDLDGEDWLPLELEEEGPQEQPEEEATPGHEEEEPTPGHEEEEPVAPSILAPRRLEEEAALQLALHRSLEPQGQAAEQEESAALRQALALSLLEQPPLEAEEPPDVGTDGKAQLVVHSAFEQDVEELDRALRAALEVHLREETVGPWRRTLPAELRARLERRHGVNVALRGDCTIIRGFGAHPARAARHLVALLAGPWDQSLAFPLAASGPTLAEQTLKGPWNKLEHLAESTGEFREVVQAFYDTLDAAHSSIRIVREAMSGEDAEVRAVPEDVSNGSSGSPSPGDTLPWNLGKTQRSRRSGGGAGSNGSVLDPAERAVIRIADERDRVQKKTFTKWVNKHLIKHWRAEAQRHISDLYEDLRDGHNLISLLEVLSGDSLPRERDVSRSSRLPREKGRMRFHKLQNVQIALDYLRHRQVKLVNIRNDDIADGNPKLTLGLIWTIILHFQISDIQVSGQSEDMTAKEKLLLWSQRMVEGYQGLRCDNFTSSWRDGRLFNAIIHRHKPMLIDMNKVYRQTNLENLDQAFSVAERDLGVTRLLDPEDVDVPQPDEKSIITYVSSLYDAMPRVPDVQDGVRANELQLRWQEYRELVLLLLQWIRHHTAAFEERRFPSSFEEIEILWSQFLKFKEMELPAKEADKNRSKGIYQSLEGAVQAGQLKVPPGYHPLDVEKEWGKLHVAILEREKQLRSEFERLECLQRIVTKLQMEAGLCEEQLNQADTLLQSDVRLLAAGKVPQRAGEVERDLDKADSMIRLLFNDVQTLKDGRHPQGEQMYRRVYRLHERLVAIRTEYNLRLKAGVAAPATQVTQVTLQSVQRRPELEDSTLRYLQDLLAWVEENQHRVDGAEWGVDLPSVEAQLGSHRGLHQSIEEFRAKIERARSDEGQLSPATRGAYRDCLGRLDLQYAKLLNSSKARLRSLESLHSFVAAATKELMWLNEKEEEEVGFDWSDRNTNMTAKKESYSALMRELELKEKKIKELQSAGDRLLREDHPARPTVESFQAALQTQWSWMLQLCCCIEAHLKENAAYFQFFSDVREAEGQLQKLQEALRRKYSCDRSATVTRLEDLLQDAQDEKEQLNEYKGHLSGLAKRAKAIVQLKPRHPAHPMRSRLPLLAVCDYKQVEVTVHKGDECQLVGPAQPSHWKVLSSSGSEAAVPSVCFLVPPPNQEAQEAVTRLEAQHQALVTLWHQLHVDMKSLLAWQSLRRDVQLIRSWSLATFRTLKPEEQRQALHSLELHYQAFLRDSQDAGGFGPEDRLMAEREYGSCSHHYQQLLQSLEQGAQEESRCQRCISELKDIRLQLEACETRTVHRLRLPLDKEPARECAQRIAEQQKAQAEVEGLGKGVARLSAEAEKVLALPEPSPAAPTLRSELELTLGKLEQVRSLSAIYLEKLKTISLVIHSTQGAEEVLRAHEEQLKEAQAVPATLPELEATKASLKKLRSQAEAQQPVFDALRDELRGAQEVGERLQQRHGERDVEVERWRERVAQLLERWQAVLAQTDVRQRELEQLGRQLRYYRESADPLGAWLQDARQRQEQIQAVPLANSQAVREQLRQEKALLEEIERHGEKVEECQRFAKQYINAIKDYELQLVTYKAQLEPVASPAKKPKVQSGSESVIQEYVDLRTRYSELTTLTSQYIKFISETLRRMEEEEMQTVQQEQLLQETQALQQSFLSEKDSLLQRERFIEQEKAKLERLFQDEVAKAQQLREEQQRQQEQMEQERQRLVASMEEARRRQHEAEEGVRRKQEELQQLEQQRRQQEELLAEENQRLREQLQRLEEEHRAALAHSEEVTASQVAAAKTLPNGRDALDGPATEAEPEHSFDGLRQKVPAQRLQEAGILSAEELQRLAQGHTTVDELARREDVRHYLQGHSSIAGLLLKPTNEKLSVYTALQRQLLSPGTALILLEAQAASGFLLDPVRNRRLTVNEAVKEGVVGPELHHKLLSAERAVTGYKDPYTGQQISLFQAMQKGLIVREHGIRLLEAQIATGGIIDPVHSHRVPVDVAYRRGYFDEEMNRVLADPSDDTKGFFDPNTHENLTYLQLLERCVEDPETGLRLLPLTDKAAKGRELVYTDSEARDVFEKATVSAPFGKFQGKTVTIWEIINSEYFTAEQRRDLLRQFRTGRITVEKIIKIIITVVEEQEQKGQLCFEGLRSLVPAAELLESRVIDRELYHQLQQGERSVREVAEVDTVRRALRGANVIAGVWLEEAGQRLSIYDALKKDLLPSDVAVALLEAQAGTGHIIDPSTSARLTVDEAVRAGLVGPEFHEKLLSAEKAVTGYRDPYTGQSVSLFQALKKGLIPREQGLRLLDAQLSTGGVVDPSKSHRVPLDVACARGFLDEETSRALSAPRADAKAYCDPSTGEPVTYSELQQRCRPDQLTGLSLLPLSEKAARARQEELYSELQARETFEKTPVDVPVGGFKGRTVTVWELISSEYFTAEQRQELLRQFRTGKVTVEKVIKILITIVEEVETLRQERLSFSGLRAPVPASELLASRVLSRAQFEQLKDGKTTVKDLSELDSVRTLLQGSGCLAGIYLEDTKEKVSIYEAMRRGLLRPSTAALLLEAQAATGFLVDPVRNQRLYVHEAVKAGVVGPELHEQLLSAEKAVTGYRDPYSGSTISLFQAMQKGLVLRQHGIRLLEAQIATGGIIDPVHSHRVPVDVAYQRGYFNEEMNRVLADPSDDTKGFFDPNTHENLTYRQLLERCVEDPETGLRLLPLKGAEKAEVVETTQVYTEEETRRAFEETQIDIPGGGSHGGSTMSLWEVMQSDLIPEEQRAQLMADFQAGRVTKERMIIIIIEIIEKTEIIRQQGLASYDYVRRRLTAEDLYEARIISLETYNLLREGTRSLREALEAESAWHYLYGTGCVAGVYLPGSRQTLSIYQALKKGLLSAEVARLLLEAQAATGFLLDPVKGQRLTVDEAVRKGLVGPELHDRLLSAERAVTGYRDPYTEQTISLFQAMKKELIPTEEALRLLDAQLATGGIVDPRLGFHLPLEVAYQRGYLNKDTHDQLSEPSEVRSYVDPSTDERLSYTQLLRRCRRDDGTGQLLLPLSDARKLTFRGLRKQITVEELVRSQVMDEATALQLREGLTSIEEVTKNLQKFLEGTSCIAGVFVDATKERLSVYQAMKKGIIRPGTAFELLEAQAATGYVIDPIKGLKLTVEEAVRMGIVGPEFKDKLLSAERAVTGYKDPYSGKLISLFQAMKKGLILKDHGIRLLEAQIATGGIIDPEESHRLPVEVAYKRGLFDEEMNEILTDPSDDTKGFFDPNTEENLTYLQLMERCITDPQTGLCLLPLKEKKRERKTSSKSSVRKRRVVIVDPETGKEMSVYEAYRKGLIDHQTYLELSEQECEWEEITISSSDGVVKSMIIDRRSGRQYDIDDAIAKNLIDRSALDQYRAGTLSITEFADMLSGNASGFRSRSSSVGSSSSYPISPAVSRTQLASWSDPTEETGPVAGILDTETLEKVSITEAMHRNLVDNITGQRLLEAQACTGGIIDPSTGERFPVTDAVNKGLVDKIMVDRINLAQKAFCGFEDPRTKTKMSAAQALKKGWLYYEAGQRFLEVQYLTGGLIEPDTPGRVPLDEALQRGTVDARTAQKLRDVGAYSKYLTCPKTKLKISYKDALDRSMVEEGTGLRLLEAAAQSSKGYYSPYSVSGSGSTAGSRTGSRTGSRAGSRRGSFDATGSGFSMTFSSSSYSSSGYGRRYASGSSASVGGPESAVA